MRLEIGPGSGKYAFKPQFREEDVIYVDLNKPSPAFSHMWVVADCQKLPFRPEVFEKAVASHVIEHLSDPLTFLNECRRTLKNGSNLKLYTPNFLSRNAKADPDHKHIFNFLSLWKLMKSAGFKPVYPALNLGNLLPKNLIRLLKIFLLAISDELEIFGVKN